MKAGHSIHARKTRGQSLVETALMLPLLLLLVMNTVNFGYFFLVIVNLTGAARSATLYAIEGSSTPAAAELPPSGNGSTVQTVTYLAFQDLTGALWNPSGASIRVCSPININANSGVNNAGTSSQEANCETCTNTSCTAAAAGTSPDPGADPEAPAFILTQVRITYTFRTLIPGTIFNIPLRAAALCGSGSCTFTRQATMRSMN